MCVVVFLKKSSKYPNIQSIPFMAKKLEQIGHLNVREVLIVHLSDLLPACLTVQVMIFHMYNILLSSICTTCVQPQKFISPPTPHALEWAGPIFLRLTTLGHWEQGWWFGGSGAIACIDVVSVTLSHLLLGLHFLNKRSFEPKLVACKLTVVVPERNLNNNNQKALWTLLDPPAAATPSYFEEQF